MKRGVLSTAQKLFDTIEFTSPSSLMPKLLLQEAWKMKIRWYGERRYEKAF